MNTNAEYKYRYVFLGAEVGSGQPMRREVTFAAAPNMADSEGWHQLSLSGAYDHGTRFQAIVRERLGVVT